MIDILFPLQQIEINIDDYVRRHRTAFDELVLAETPNPTLIDTLKATSLLQVLLEHSPVKDNRLRLRDAILQEVRRQTRILIAEYTSREVAGTIEASNSLRLDIPDSGKPPAQVIGMKTVEIGATIAR